MYNHAVNNAPSAPFARSNRATLTDTRARAKRRPEPHFDGVSCARFKGAAISPCKCGFGSVIYIYCYDFICYTVHALFLHVHFAPSEYFQLFNLLYWSILFTLFYYMNTASKRRGFILDLRGLLGDYKITSYILIAPETIVLGAINIGKIV